MFLLIWINIIAFTVSSQSSDTSLALPDGWIYIGLEANDTYPGAFHDEKTGAFVESRYVPIRGIIVPTSEWAHKKGSRLESKSFRGIRYDVASKKLPDKCEQLNISVFIHPEYGGTWNLDTKTCQQPETERLTTLIQHLAKRTLLESLVLSTPWNAVLTKQDTSLLRPGTAWAEFYERGSPLNIEKVLGGGFKARYTYKGSAGGQELLLEFSKSRSLVHWESLRNK